MSMKRNKNDIGFPDKWVEGKKAILTKEVSFYNSFQRTKENRIYFQPGTVVTGVYEATGTGLTVFTFIKENNKTVNFQLREDAYEFVD